MRMPNSTDFVSSVHIQWLCHITGHMRSVAWVRLGCTSKGPEQV